MGVSLFELPIELVHEIVTLAASRPIGPHAEWDVNPRIIDIEPERLGMRLTCKFFDDIVLDRFMVDWLRRDYDIVPEDLPFGNTTYHPTRVPSVSELDMARRLLAQQVETDRRRGKTAYEVVSIVLLGADTAVEVLKDAYDDLDELRQKYTDALIDVAVITDRPKMVLLGLGLDGALNFDFYNYNDRYTLGLIGAACLGRVQDMRRFVDSGADPLCPECYEAFQSPFDAAAIGGSVDAMKFLIEEGIDVYLFHDLTIDSSPLHYAALAGSAPTVEFLMSLDIDGNDMNLNGETPILCAAATGRVDVVDLLLDYNVTINNDDHQEGTPLIYAVRRGLLDVVKVLLEKGSPWIEALDNWGANALGIAAQKGREDIFDALVEYQKTNDEGKGLPGYRVLEFAIQGGNENILRKALSWHMRNPNWKWTREPLYLESAAKIGHDSIIEILLAHDGGSVDETRRAIARAINAAAGAGRESTLKLLLDHPIIKSWHLPSGHPARPTPLHHAAAAGHLGIVKLLLQRDDIDSNETIEGHKTPLSNAARYGRAEIVKLLVAQPGIDINSNARLGLAPLHLAIMYGRSGVVKTLLETPGISTYTALYRAVKHHSHLEAKMLLESGVPISRTEVLQCLNRTSNWGTDHAHKRLLEYLASMPEDLPEPGEDLDPEIFLDPGYIPVWGQEDTPSDIFDDMEDGDSESDR